MGQIDQDYKTALEFDSYLEERKLADDPCGRCGCKRKYHNPPKAYTGSKDYRNMGPNSTPQIEVKAKTCCDSCPYCLCFCIGFMEPFKG
jgi:hypothetical protein